jgi:hypothetical protein
MTTNEDGTLTLDNEALRALISSVYRAGALAMRESIEDRAFERDWSADTTWIGTTPLPEGLH